MSKKELIERIHSAFSDAQYPGDGCLSAGRGDEPLRVTENFKGKKDWRTLDPEFIDLAPRGLASALSFFSDEAFRFYLPAYLIADINGKIRQSNPVFHLTHGLDDESRHKQIDPYRTGARTFFDHKSCKFAMFTPKEAAAIVAYLEYKRRKTSFEAKSIKQALRSYWYARAQTQST